jgi:hypothetical protein
MLASSKHCSIGVYITDRVVPVLDRSIVLFVDCRGKKFFLFVVFDCHVSHVCFHVSG